jgi:hypothetical protein
MLRTNLVLLAQAVGRVDERSHHVLKLFPGEDETVKPIILLRILNVIWQVL